MPIEEVFAHECLVTTWMLTFVHHLWIICLEVRSAGHDQRLPRDMILTVQLMALEVFRSGVDLGTVGTSELLLSAFATRTLVGVAGRTWRLLRSRG